MTKFGGRKRCARARPQMTKLGRSDVGGSPRIRSIRVPGEMPGYLVRAFYDNLWTRAALDGGRMRCVLREI